MAISSWDCRANGSSPFGTLASGIVDLAIHLRGGRNRAIAAQIEEIMRVNQRNVSGWDVEQVAQLRVECSALQGHASLETMKRIFSENTGFLSRLGRALGVQTHFSEREVRALGRMIAVREGIVMRRRAAREEARVKEEEALEGVRALQESTEFHINEVTEGAQMRSTVGPAGPGFFWVAWDDRNREGKVRVYSLLTGTPNSEHVFTSREVPSGEEVSPTVGFTSGGFATVWVSRPPYGNNAAQGRLFVGWSSGDFSSSERVAVNAASIQQHPVLAVLPNGRYVTAWLDPNDGVWAQEWSPPITRFGAPKHLTTEPLSRPPSIAVLSDGGYVVNWVESPSKRVMQWITGDSEATQVNVLPAPGGIVRSALAPLTNARHLVVWMGNEPTSDSRQVRGQQYQGASKIGGEFRINTNPTHSSFDALVTGNLGTRIVVVWISQGPSIVGQLLDLNGAKIGSEFSVSPYVGTEPAVTGLIDGGGIVTWTSSRAPPQEPSDEGIFGQRLDASGNKVPLLLPSSSGTPGASSDRDESRIGGLSQGAFIALLAGGGGACIVIPLIMRCVAKLDRAPVRSAEAEREAKAAADEALAAAATLEARVEQRQAALKRLFSGMAQAIVGRLSVSPEVRLQLAPLLNAFFQHSRQVPVEDIIEERIPTHILLRRHIEEEFALHFSAKAYLWDSGAISAEDVQREADQALIVAMYRREPPIEERGGAGGAAAGSSVDKAFVSGIKTGAAKKVGEAVGKAGITALRGVIGV